MSGSARVTAPTGSSGHPLRDSALAFVPETLQHYLLLNTAIWDEGPLSAADVELARLRNARHVGCVFCKAVRYDVAIEAGLDEARVNMINDEFMSSQLSHREKLILQFADLYLLAPAPPSPQLQQAMEQEFSEAERTHLALVMAYFNGFSRCAVALGGMPDELPRMEISIPR